MRRVVSLILVVGLVFAGVPAGVGLAVATVPQADPNAGLDFSPGEIEDWALGCSAILAVRNETDPYLFGMLPVDDASAQEAAASVLSRDWAVENREDLLGAIAYLVDGGHNTDFVEAYGLVSALSRADYKTMLRSAQGMDRYMWPLTKELGEKWGDRQIKAWDWFRVIHIVGWGYHAGYLDRGEAYACMAPTLALLKSTFSSWEEATQNYMDGYAWWSRTDVSQPDTEYRLRLDIYQDLKKDRFLFNPELWFSQDEPEDTSIFYAEGFRCEDNGDGTCTLVRNVGEAGAELLIPETINGLTVTAIGDHAFSGCGGYTGGLTLPKGLVTIGEYAFSSCYGFRGQLVLPEGVTTIGKSAFYLCQGFSESLILPEGLTTIGWGAFAYCMGLSGDLILPDSLIRIEDDAFSNCFALTGVTIPAGAEIAKDAFIGCRGITSFDVSEQNEFLVSLDGILYNKEQTEIVLVPRGIQIENYVVPDSVTTVADFAFYGCTGLTGTLTLPGSVTSIGLWGFGGCEGLTGLILPEGIEKIGREAFHGCTGLEALTLPGSVTLIEQGAFSGCSALTELHLPEGLTTLGDYAFSNCVGLTGIILPKGLKSIGEWAFQGCSSLAVAEFLGKAPSALGDEVFRDCAPGFRILYNPEMSGWKTPEWKGWRCYSAQDPQREMAQNADYDFEINDNRDGTCTIIGFRGEETGDLVIPTQIKGLTVTVIGEAAFGHCKGFTGCLILPEGVTTVEKGAFQYSGLTSVSLPRSVAVIGDDAFKASDLTSIEVSAENEHFSSIDGILFNGDHSVLIHVPWGIQRVDYVIPDGVVTLSAGAFRGCKGLTGTLTIPEGVAVIEEGVFSHCVGLERILIPGSVTEIGGMAFSDCDGLTSLEVSEQNPTFASLEGMLMSRDLTEIIQMPKGIAKEDFVIPGGVTTIRENAFFRCRNLTGTLTLPEGLTTIGEKAFSSCEEITGVLIPASVTVIGDRAFTFCKRLSVAAFVGDAPAQFGEKGFDSCADDFRITYDPEREGWSTPAWNEYPAEPR